MRTAPNKFQLNECVYAVTDWEHGNYDIKTYYEPCLAEGLVELIIFRDPECGYKIKRHEHWFTERDMFTSYGLAMARLRWKLDHKPAWMALTRQTMTKP